MRHRMVMGWCGIALVAAILSFAVISMAESPPKTVTLRVPVEALS